MAQYPRHKDINVRLSFTTIHNLIRVTLKTKTAGTVSFGSVLLHFHHIRIYCKSDITKAFMINGVNTVFFADNQLVRFIFLSV